VQRHQSTTKQLCATNSAVLTSNTISVKIAYKHFNCLIDTGAAISLLSQKVLDKLPHYCYDIVSCKLPVIFTASGQALPITKAVSLTLNVNGLLLPFTFNVVSALSPVHSIILGMDFLTACNCVINVATNTLSFLNDLTTVNIQTRRSATLHVARVTKDIIIPQGTEMIMPLTVSASLNADIFELSPITELGKKSIAMARAIVQPINGTVNCRIVNPTNTPISLKCNTVIGTLHSVDVNSITPFDPTHDNDEFDEKSESDRDFQQLDQSTAESIVKDLGIDLTSCSLNETDKNTLVKLLANNADVFAKDMSQFGSVKGYTHHIDT
jgi:hypothetical protein